MAAPEFTGFTDETLGFLAGLKANNTRDWFNENRKAYEAAVKQPAEAFADIMAGELETLTGVAHKPKLFRINRDIRFSKDKTPYNTHVHSAWMPVDGGEGAPAWMFGLSTEYCTLGCGVFEFPKGILATYRHKIAMEYGDDLGRIVGGLKADGYRLQEPALKRVPPGFPDDHPWVELSLHKGIMLWRDLEAPDAATKPDLMDRCLRHFGELLPLWRFLRDLG
jgi:uncharacterized protein (TIGR02453 family)